MLEILVRQPPRADDADNPIRLCYTGPSPDREHQLEIEARFGFEIVCGYALSETPYALVWRHGERPYGTLGSARQHPELGHVNDARVIVDGRVAAVGEEGELELRNPAIMRGVLRDARGDGGGDRRRLAAHRRSRARQRRRDLHVSRPQEGSHPPAGREPLARGGGGDARTASRRGRGGGDRRAVGPLRGGREGVRGGRGGTHAGPGCAARVRTGAPRGLQGAALHRGGRRAAAHGDRPAGQAQAPSGADAGRSGLRARGQSRP